MNTNKSSLPSTGVPGQIAKRNRKCISLDGASLVTAKPLNGGDSPLVFYAEHKDLDLTQWARANTVLIKDRMIEYGALLFRNFRVGGLQGYKEFLHLFSEGENLKVVDQNIQAEVAPPEHDIFFHNEYSDRSRWPINLFYYCLNAQGDGGETPIVDCQKILEIMDKNIWKTFEEKGWLLVRNFGLGLGPSCQEAFGTTDPAVISSLFRGKRVEINQLSDQHLRIKIWLPAITPHPQTQQPLWFNNLAFYNLNSLQTELQDAIRAQIAEEDFPNHSYYGDHTPIEPGVMQHIRECYQDGTRVFPWINGDVLMLDNMRTAHGRRAFKGQQEVFVGATGFISG